MAMKLTQLQCKEVICISDGRRLGFIEDVEVEVPEGQICAIIVPGPGSFLGLASKVFTRLITVTGPKISRSPTVIPGFTLSRMVGPTKKPFS